MNKVDKAFNKMYLNGCFGKLGKVRDTSIRINNKYFKHRGNIVNDDDIKTEIEIVDKTLTGVAMLINRVISKLEGIYSVYIIYEQKDDEISVGINNVAKQFKISELSDTDSVLDEMIAMFVANVNDNPSDHNH